MIVVSLVAQNASDQCLRFSETASGSMRRDTGQQDSNGQNCPVSTNLVQGQAADLHRTRFSETRGSRLSQ